MTFFCVPTIDLWDKVKGQRLNRCTLLTCAIEQDSADFRLVSGIETEMEVREMNWLRIVEYILLLILVIGFAYQTYVLGFKWSFAAGIVIPLILIVLLFIEDRMK